MKMLLALFIMCAGCAASAYYLHGIYAGIRVFLVSMAIAFATILVTNWFDRRNRQ